MPGSDTATQDKPREAPASEGRPPAAPSGTDKQDAFFKSFKSREEAEKGWDELHSALTKTAQERAEIEKDREELKRRMDEMQHDTVRKLAELAASNANRAPTEADIEAEEAKILEDLQGDNGAQTILKLNRTTASLAQQYARQVDSTLRKELAEVKAVLSEMQETSTPVYQKNRDLIEKAVKGLGVTRKQAIAMLEMVPGVPQPESEPPPSTASNQRGTDGHSKRTGPAISDDERQRLKDMGISDKELADMEARYAGRG